MTLISPNPDNDLADHKKTHLTMKDGFYTQKGKMG